MNVIKVQGQPVTVNSGQVRLTKAQAASRAHAIRMVGKPERDGAVYDVLAPLSFKIGETFGYSGEASKAGQLRDPEAEALAKLELEDRIRTEVRAEERAKHEKARAELEQKFALALAEQEARLRAELVAVPPPAA